MTSRVVSSPVSPAGPGGRTARRSPRSWLLLAPVAALAAMVLTLMAGGGAPEPPAAGLPDPGLVTGWGVPVSRLVLDLSAVAVIGALVTALLLPQTRFDEAARPLLRAAGWAAGLWAASAALLLLLTISDILGVPPPEVLGSGRLSGYAWEVSQGRGLLLAVACGVLLTAYTRWTRTRVGVSVLLAVAVTGLLPLLFSGHSAAASDHDLATSSLVVHVLAASVWVGGLVGVLTLLWRSPRTLAEVLPRYSVLALICFAAVAFSGLLNAWVRTSGDVGVWAGSAYGALLAVKITALVGLAGLGWWHRRRTVTDLVAGRPRAFVRLAVAETALMAVTFGVAVSLSRTPPPAGAAVEIPSHGLGHPTLGSDVAPFTLTSVVTQWRLEAISLLVVAVAFAFYLASVRRLRRRGVAWPLRRPAAAAAAAGCALVATSGGLATYSTATFSVMVAQFLVLFVVVPTLVALSAPVTLLVLALRPADGTQPGALPSALPGALPGALPSALPSALRGRAAVWLTDPLNTLIVATVMLFSLYATPLLEASLRSAPLHLAVNLCTLAVGCLFWWSVLGVDPAPVPRPRAYRLWVLVGFLVLIGGVGARIFLSDVVLAGAWFADLDWRWVNMVRDQRVGAALMWAGAVLLGPALAALVLRRRSPGAVGPG
jgi:cytochrome c oxidase assembly factor CtaG/putative copper export protein